MIILMLMHFSSSHHFFLLASRIWIALDLFLLFILVGSCGLEYLFILEILESFDVEMCGCDGLWIYILCGRSLDFLWRCVEDSWRRYGFWRCIGSVTYVEVL